MTWIAPWLMSGVLAVCPLGPGAPRRLPPPAPVRALAPVLLNAYAAARHRSVTFRRLTVRIAELRGIVYVDFSETMAHRTDACLLHWIAGHESRYLRILIRNGTTGDRLMALLGHELQHAVEALEDVTVVDAITIRSRFARLAGRTIQSDSTGPLETSEAIAVEHRIANELTEWRRLSVP